MSGLPIDNRALLPMVYLTLACRQLKGSSCVCAFSFYCVKSRSAIERIGERKWFCKMSVLSIDTTLSMFGTKSLVTPFVSLDWTTSVASRCAVSRAAIAPTRLSSFTSSWDPPWHSTASVSIVCMGTEHCELVQNRMTHRE